MTEKVYFTSKRVRHRYGDCSDMTLWRWTHDPTMSFPKPTYIKGRRYWDADELDEFDRARSSVGEAA